MPALLPWASLGGGPSTVFAGASARPSNHMTQIFIALLGCPGCEDALVRDVRAALDGFPGQNGQVRQVRFDRETGALIRK